MNFFPPPPLLPPLPSPLLRQDLTVALAPGTHCVDQPSLKLTKIHHLQSAGVKGECHHAICKYECLHVYPTYSLVTYTWVTGLDWVITNLGNFILLCLQVCWFVSSYLYLVSLGFPWYEFWLSVWGFIFLSAPQIGNSYWSYLSFSFFLLYLDSSD